PGARRSGASAGGRGRGRGDRVPGRVRGAAPAAVAGHPGGAALPVAGVMTPIFRRALGADFARLHPRLRERFGFASTDGIGCVGTGVMSTVWRGSALAV